MRSIRVTKKPHLSSPAFTAGLLVKRIKDPVTGDIIVKKGSLMDETTSIAVENVGHDA